MRPDEAEALGWHDAMEAGILDPMHFPALPDDPASSMYHAVALEQYRAFQKPGSRDMNAPMRAAQRAGQWPLVDLESPQPGYYKRRLIRRGPFFPIRFFYTVGCEFQGAYVDPAEHWSWACKYPISKDEYKALEAWCGEF